MRTLIRICRILVGATFIISGLIKANDPVGFSIKLGEYFEESALGLPWLEPYALGLAMLACLGEVVLGFAVLFGGRMKLATWALLLLTLFFGWLTAYTATCDPMAKYEVTVNGVTELRSVTCVTDCGCFGDAMKGSLGRSLTPWESFTKDIILLVFVLPIFFLRKRIAFNDRQEDMILLPIGLALVGFYSWVFSWWFPLFFTALVFAGYLVIKQLLKGVKGEWATAVWVALAALAFMLHTWVHLPIRDYRPYAIGMSIPQQMAEAKPPVNITYVTYRNLATGVETEYSTNEPYPWDDPNYAFVEGSTRVKEVEPGIDSQVRDFMLFDRDGDDLTDDVLSDPQPVLLIVSASINEAATKCQPAINQLAQTAQEQGWTVYGVSSSSHDATEQFRHDHQNMFEYLTCDGVTLKTVIRSNPGVVLMQQGTIRGKWSCSDVPAFDKAARALR